MVSHWFPHLPPQESYGFPLEFDLLWLQLRRSIIYGRTFYLGTYFLRRGRCLNPGVAKHLILSVISDPLCWENNYPQHPHPKQPQIIIKARVAPSQCDLVSCCWATLTTSPMATHFTGNIHGPIAHNRSLLAIGGFLKANKSYRDIQGGPSCYTALTMLHLFTFATNPDYIWLNQNKALSSRVGG